MLGWVWQKPVQGGGRAVLCARFPFYDERMARCSYGETGRRSCGWSPLGGAGGWIWWIKLVGEAIKLWSIYLGFRVSKAHSGGGTDRYYAQDRASY